jgi:hypothetical protein
MRRHSSSRAGAYLAIAARNAEPAPLKS